MGKFKNIFEWCEWDDISDDFEIYYDCELLVDVGEYKEGHEFANIQFDKKRLVLYFCKDEDDEPIMTKKFILEY